VASSSTLVTFQCVLRSSSRLVMPGFWTTKRRSLSASLAWRSAT